MKYSLLGFSGLAVLLSGCTATELLSRNLPPEAAQSFHIYSRNEDSALNLVDRALATCPDATEAAETTCVRDAIAQGSLSPRALARLIPGCSLGSICTYDHTTRRRFGLIPVYATVMTKDWRVTIDLRREMSDAALLPVAVKDRNLFVVPPSAAPKVVPTKVVAE